MEGLQPLQPLLSLLSLLSLQLLLSPLSLPLNSQTFIQDICSRSLPVVIYFLPLLSLQPLPSLLSLQLLLSLLSLPLNSKTFVRHLFKKFAFCCLLCCFLFSLPKQRNASFQAPPEPWRPLRLQGKVQGKVQVYYITSLGHVHRAAGSLRWRR